MGGEYMKQLACIFLYQITTTSVKVYQSGEVLLASLHECIIKININHDTLKSSI